MKKISYNINNIQFPHWIGNSFQRKMVGKRLRAAVLWEKRVQK